MVASRKFLCWLLLGSALVLLPAGCSSPKPQVVNRVAGPPTTEQFQAGEHGTLAFELPDGWTYTIYKTSPVIPASFQLDSPDKNATVRFRVSWDGIDSRPSNPSAGELERLLRNRAERRIRLSEEDSVNVKTITTAGGVAQFAQFAQFTESIWVNAEVAPGNYRYATDGVFRCGNLWGSFSIYSQDKLGESFRPALAIVQSLRQLDPKP